MKDVSHHSKCIISFYEQSVTVCDSWILKVFISRIFIEFCMNLGSFLVPFSPFFTSYMSLNFLNYVYSYKSGSPATWWTKSFVLISRACRRLRSALSVNLIARQTRHVVIMWSSSLEVFHLTSNLCRQLTFSKLVLKHFSSLTLFHHYSH